MTLCMHVDTAHGAAARGFAKCMMAREAPSVLFCIHTCRNLLKSVTACSKITSPTPRAKLQSAIRQHEAYSKHSGNDFRDGSGVSESYAVQNPILVITGHMTQK
jgi:hypothetical protein